MFVYCYWLIAAWFALPHAHDVTLSIGARLIASEDEVRVLFKCLDEDCNGNVDPEEFLRLADILRYELTPMPRPLPYEPGRARNVWGRLYDAFTYPSPTMLPLIYSRWFKRVVKGVLVCNTIAIIAWYPGNMLGVDLSCILYPL